MSWPNPVELDAGADHAEWLANEYDPPTLNDVADHEDEAEWLERFLAEVDTLANHFDTAGEPA